MNKGFLPRHWIMKWVMFAGRRPWTVILISFMLMICSGLVIGRIQFQSDIMALLPEHNERVRLFRDTIQQFGSTDILLVAFELKSPEDLEPSLAFADSYVAELRKSERISWVEYRLKDFSDAALELLDQATLFLPPSELDDFISRFQPGAEIAIAKELAEKVRSPMDIGLKELLKRDPLNLLPLLSKKMKMDQLGPRFDRETGYMIDAKRKYLLLLVKPVRPAADIPFGRLLFQDLDGVYDRARMSWKKEAFEMESPTPLYGGGYPIAAEDSKLIVSDMTKGALSSLIGVVLLFAFSFRRPAAVFVSFVPLVIGLILTFCFAALALGRLNTATTAFAALLIGLGIDFIIVLYGRYVEERNKGVEHFKALEALAGGTAVGVLLGAVTTAATFFAFLLSGFKGLSELGLLTGSGILIVVATVFLLLPALLTLLNRGKVEKVHHMTAFGLDKLVFWSLNHSRQVLIVSLLLCLLGGYGLSKLEYNDDILSMRSNTNLGVLNQNKIMDAFGIRFTPMMLRIDGVNEAEMIQRAKVVLEKLKPLVDGETLGKVDSAVAFLPQPSDQQRVLARLSAEQIDVSAYRQRLTQALEAEGLNPDPFLEGLEPILKSLQVTAPLTLNSVKSTALGHMLSRYIFVTDQSASTLIFCYAPAGKWRRSVPPKLFEALQGMPGVNLTGPMVISQELKDIVLKDATIAGVLGLVVVFLLLALDLGSLVRGLLALVPLLVGMLWMVGFMGLAHLPVNFMNIFVFTMVIGIGVDYGVHLIHRWQETGSEQEPLANISKAIVIAALTTVMGFGSLAFSSFPGIRSMGYAAIIGALATALASLTFLTALLKLIEKK